MALSKEDIEKIRKKLKETYKPIYFYHDDPDGLCSFLQFYRVVRDGKGIIIKSSPRVDTKFVKAVNGFSPDNVFILDLAIVDQEFIDEVKGTPITWIDHHEPLKRHGIKYFNPRIAKHDDNQPVSYLCHKITKNDLWISMVGCIGDWYMPDFADEFKKDYPDLLPKNIKKPEDALFNSKLGELVRIFSFILKGPTYDVMKCIKILTRIDSPYEILKQETPRGKYIFKKAEKINRTYKQLLKNALKEKPKDNMVIFTYADDQMSFTKELANEVLYNNPKCRVIIGRKKSGEMKMSLRGSYENLPSLVKQALVGVEGYGGGHEHACGACVKLRDFDRFIENFKNAK